jgi:hypothetical protein
MQTVFPFSDIFKAPEGPGLYAWYYRPALSNADINKFISQIDEMVEASEKQKVLARVFSENILAPFREKDLNLSFRGALKGVFSGTAKHQIELTEKLVDRIVSDSERLRVIGEIIQDSIPVFARPIYIGKAKLSLRDRLRQHADSINRYLESRSSSFMPIDGESFADEETQEYHTFAREVVLERQLDIHFLQVGWMEVPAARNNPDILTVVENMLNRINQPICGRN